VTQVEILAANGHKLKDTRQITCVGALASRHIDQKRARQYQPTSSDQAVKIKQLPVGDPTQTLVHAIIGIPKP
jgi:hypothetical protein